MKKEVVLNSEDLLDNYIYYPDTEDFLNNTIKEHEQTIIANITNDDATQFTHEKKMVSNNIELSMDETHFYLTIDGKTEKTPKSCLNLDAAITKILWRAEIKVKIYSSFEWKNVFDPACGNTYQKEGEKSDEYELDLCSGYIRWILKDRVNKALLESDELVALSA